MCVRDGVEGRVTWLVSRGAYLVFLVFARAFLIVLEISCLPA